MPLKKRTIMDLSIDFFTINTNSIKNKKTRFVAYEYLKDIDADIIFLQETRLSSLNDIKEAKREWREGLSFWSLGTEPAGG
ncbi:hypothetical protein XELAEV_18043704mg, partial [Xenopus laevis]